MSGVQKTDSPPPPKQTAEDPAAAADAKAKGFLDALGLVIALEEVQEAISELEE